MNGSAGSATHRGMNSAMKTTVNSIVNSSTSGGMGDLVNSDLHREAPEQTSDALRPGTSANRFALRFGRSIREQVVFGWAKLAKLGNNLRPRAARQLRLCETLPLGERRFVSVVQFEEQKFLIGSAANSVVLLTRLEKQKDVPAPSGMHFRKKPTASTRWRKQKSK